jgi:Tol biopolymer transport system component
MEIVVRDPSSTLETVVAKSEYQMTVSDWSPGDTRLLFAEWTSDRGGQIKVVDVEADAEPELVLGGEPEEWGAVLSPEGNWMAYTSDRSGTYEVYVMPYPVGPDAGSVKISVHPVSEEAHWSVEGDAVIYRSMGEWWRVPLSFRPGPVPGTPELVMRGAFLNVPGKSWDLLRDGRFLLADGSRVTTSDRIHVIPDFAGEVARRVAESQPD